MSKTEQTLQDQLSAALTQTLDENDLLRAELARLRTELATARSRLEAVLNADGAVAVLRQIAHDETMPPDLRVKAASALAQYERPKLAVTAKTSNFSLFNFLEEARLREQKTINQPKAPALASDHAGEALDPDSAA
jgi:cell division septum initiation protein DivIVA